MSEIKSRLSLDSSGFVSGLSKSENALNKFAKNAAMSFAGLFAADRLASFAASFVEWGDQIDAASKKLRLSVTETQALQYAAEQAGSSFDAVQVAVGKLMVGIGRAATDKKLEESFSRLGVSAEMLRRENPTEVLTQLAKAYDDSAGSASTLADMQTVLGKGYQELIPLFSELSENLAKFDKDTMALTDSQVRTLKKAGDAWKEFALQVKVGTASAFSKYSDFVQVFANLAVGAFTGTKFDFAEPLRPKEDTSTVNTVEDKARRRAAYYNAQANESLTALSELEAKRAEKVSDVAEAYAKASAEVKRLIQEGTSLFDAPVSDDIESRAKRSADMAEIRLRLAKENIKVEELGAQLAKQRTQEEAKLTAELERQAKERLSLNEQLTEARFANSIKGLGESDRLKMIQAYIGQLESAANALDAAGQSTEATKLRIEAEKQRGGIIKEGDTKIVKPDAPDIDQWARIGLFAGAGGTNAFDKLADLSRQQLQLMRTGIKVQPIFAVAA